MIDLLCLLEFYNTYEHDNVFYTVSEKMLHHFDKINEMGMQELADYLFISTSTLYRFVKMLTYENYNQMRISQQMFLEQYMHRGRYFPMLPSAMPHTLPPTSLKDYGTYFSNRILELSATLDEDHLLSLTEQLLLAEEIIFIGQPMPSALWRLQIELVLLGKRTSAFLNPQYQIEAVHNACEGALVFITQYMPEESAFYLNIAQEAKEKQLKTLAISSLPLSPTLKYIDDPLVFKGDLLESDLLLIEFLFNLIGHQLNQKVLEEKQNPSR